MGNRPMKDGSLYGNDVTWKPNLTGKICKTKRPHTQQGWDTECLAENCSAVFEDYEEKEAWKEELAQHEAHKVRALRRKSTETPVGAEEKCFTHLLSLGLVRSLSE